MKFVWEHNCDDTLLYSVDYIGAYTRGETLDVAKSKMKDELLAYLFWNDQAVILDETFEILQEKSSNLQIADADSDVLFESEKESLSQEEYMELKRLVLKSAHDFQTLYDSVPDKSASCIPFRKTFYGAVPRSAEEMYIHTRNVNSYYFGEIGVEVDHDGSIYECRKRGFDILEQTTHFLDFSVMEGSYGELWSLRKMMRRFVWHDRIHAKAMYRMAIKTFEKHDIKNPFHFTL